MLTNRLGVVALLLAAAAGAQSTKVVPGFCAGSDGNDSSYFPFLYDKTLVQQVWDGASICNAIALISDIRMRRDAADPTPLPAQAIVGLLVRIGYSGASPGSMSTTFAANRTGTMTQIFSGTHSRPAQPPPTAATGAFNISWPIATPFLYTRSSGNLLFEFEIPGIANAKTSWPVDAIRTGANGSFVKYGNSGVFASREAFNLDCTSQPAQLVPGGSAAFTVAGLKSPYPTLLVLGLSRTWSTTLGLPLPVDLGPFNAAGNSIHVSPDVSFALPLLQQGGLWGGTSTLPIPMVAGLEAQSVYAQLMCIDPLSNGLGLVLSHGLQVSLGSTTHFTQILGASDSTSASGFFMYGAGEVGGPVVEFAGTFG